MTDDTSEGQVRTGFINATNSIRHEQLEEALRSKVVEQGGSLPSDTNSPNGSL